MPFSSKKGIALIAGVAILGILCLLAVTFAKIAQLDQSAVASYELNTNARFIANAGLHFAVSKVREHIAQHGIISWNNAAFQNPYKKAEFQQRTYQYKVEAYETSSFLNINHPDAIIETDLSDSSKKDYPLERMITNLALYLGISQTKAKNLGKEIVQNRPMVEMDAAHYIKSGYKTVDQVRELTKIDKDTLDTIKPYLGTHGWVNVQSVVYKKGAGNLVVDDLSTAKRSPININAASKEVIAAALCGIKADDGTEISFEKALEVAEYLVSNRPFLTWNEFRQELRVCPGINFKEAELIFIATTTNAHTRNYDEPSYYVNYISPEGHYSKANVVVANTEFSLGPLGCFYLKSTGEITQSNEVISQFIVTTVVKLFECYRLSSEREYDLSCIQDQTNAIITGPFSGESQTTYHSIVGNVMIDFFSEPSGYQIIPIPGSVMTATGGGGQIVMQDIVNQPFSATCYIDGNGRLENPIELQWIQQIETYRICHHLHYNATDNSICLSSLLIGDPSKGIIQEGYEICYKTKLKQAWQSALQTILAQLHWNAASYIFPDNTPDTPKIGDTRMVIKYNEALGQEFAGIYLGQVYDAFASGSQASFSLPLTGKIEYDLERWNGTEWVYVSTETTSFNATEYLKIANFSYPYMSLFDGIFENMPANIQITRPNIHIASGQEYQEYINKDLNFIHPFDRSRWEKKVPGPFPPYSCLFLSVSPSSEFEPKLSVESMEFIENPKGKKQIKITSLEVQNDEPKMGATLNYWVGNTTKSTVSGKTIFQPSNTSQSVYVGRFTPAIPGSSWWTLGTFRWTGYNPVEGTSIQMFFEGKEVFQDGTWKIALENKIYQKGDEVHFKVILYNNTAELLGKTQPMITPFFEEVLCFAMVESYFYLYQEEWNY
ncbi:MAG: hypothetical protein HUU50_13200 [Candidatus Brocadiae bacterium]|nr:hypothetical protein [Candidatus Brocadiia bacterium]